MAWQKRKAMGHYAVERLYRQQLSDFMDLGGLARYWRVTGTLSARAITAAGGA